MKILHVNSSDNEGGAAIAAMRHCEAMRIAGIEAEFLCVSPKSCKPYSHGLDSLILRNTFSQRVFNKLNFRIANKSKPFASWSYAEYGFNITNHPLINWADEIWIHWVNGGMLSIKSIEKLLKLGKPLTWYFHDMWPMTGGCHYSLGCDGFKNECGKCPMFYSHQGSDDSKDLSYRQLYEKTKRWSGYKNLRILTPSHWLADLANSSALFGNNKTRIGVLPNPINTSVFKHISKSEARRKLNLPQDKKLILFGAHIVSDPYKGMQYLIDALPKLAGNNIECIVFGQNFSINKEFPVKINSVGSISDVELLKTVYSAADVFVTPSIADNYPNVLVEAMACGTPCVGFNIGGVPEIINNGVSGIIADKVSAESLADAIFLALSSSAELGVNARQQVEKINSFSAYSDRVWAQFASE